MADHCREQATDHVLSIPGAGGFVQELAPHYQDLNGGILWKLTSAARFPPPKLMQVTCMAHSSQGKDGEQIALPKHRVHAP